MEKNENKKLQTKRNRFGTRLLPRGTKIAILEMIYTSQKGEAFDENGKEEWHVAGTGISF